MPTTYTTQFNDFDYELYLEEEGSKLSHRLAG